MATLKFKTRGEQTAQGKQKAYFCAHPDDYGQHFEKITEEILGTLEKENNRNCAFFYLEDANAERDDEFLFGLKEMNLLVMPVTTRLLTTKNPALDVEFRFATENGIPVLPLMMESGLEDVFNAKCGDLQFLDPNSRDLTAISYEEKLTKYLTSVLIGDELAEKIRKAFDAYIFLSYRKKDRKYAQELMKLIHKNEFCRDVAIWYDEFLTPGENFNKSIEDALNKSKLFALAVTPSLLEKSVDKDGNECENYIVTTEYPMAKKADKLILPAELVETDKDKLSGKYENIPACVNANDEPGLTKSLEDALEGIALRENDNDPEHNFFIGLAYLGGLDVEKDIDRAIKLITSSAEAGLPEAMEKLVSIYRNGEIGERDYEKAIKWQRKLVEYRKKAYEEERDERSAACYLQQMLDLGNDLYFELHYTDAADRVYADMLGACKMIHESFASLWSYDALAGCYSHIGDIKRAQRQLTEAEKYYLMSLHIYEEISKISNADLLQNKIWITCHRLGGVCTNGMRISDAEAYYLKALRALEGYGEDDRNCERLGDLMVAYNDLGDNRDLAGDTAAAEKYYREAARVGEIIADKANSLEIKRRLADTFGNIANIRRFALDLDGVAEWYEKELGIRKTIADETGTINDLYYLAVAYSNLADSLWEDKELIIKYLTLAYEILRGLSEMRPDIREYTREMKNVKFSLDMRLV